MLDAGSGFDRRKDVLMTHSDGYVTFTVKLSRFEAFRFALRKLLARLLGKPEPQLFGWRWYGVSAITNRKWIDDVYKASDL